MADTHAAATSLRSRATSPLGSFLLVAIVALASAILVEQLRPTVPQTHDEFSYLLTADTFRQGRLANPTHPMWRYFESPHVMHEPTYVSKYPPLQGAILALGWTLGNPVYGVALSFALACAATCWMLRAWLEPNWALLGGLMLALHPQLSVVWGNWMWGGAGALLGGALLYGAIPRLVGEPRWRDGVWLGIGISLLALSRPYEGAVACLPAAVGYGIGVWRASPTRRRDVLLRGSVPAMAILGTTALLLGTYNHRTTGDPLTLTYTLYDQTYAAVPALIVLPPYAPKTYRHRVLADFYGPRAHNSQYHWRRASIEGFLTGVEMKFWVFLRFFTLYGLTAALFALPWAWCEPGVRFAVAACALFAAALAIETHEYPHYAAPFVPLAAFLIVVALRRMWRVRSRRLAVGHISVVLLLAAAFAEHWVMADMRLSKREHQSIVARADILRDLQAQGGRHLVLVRYAHDHNPHFEWVYNAANIDSAPVIWARDSGTARNGELLQYFEERNVWLIQPDIDPYRIERYPPRE
ncbi:hypothetical protein MK489_04920 [Myxococcota bacterium]|nr:hypothetical protein [Myxococcota bacterium]